MASIRQYLLSVTAAALICSIVKTFTSGKGMLTSAVKMVCGIFLAITVFSPIVTMDFTSMQWKPAVFFNGAEAAVAYGTATAESELQKIIKEKTEAYILDKASSLHLNITAEVTVDQCSPFIPCAVTLYGTAPPYAKQTLEEFIAKELGIPKEDQQWI